jgi:hypothetical protein
MHRGGAHFNQLVIVNLYLRDCSGFPNVSLSGLSTLFDASLLELKAAVFAAFFWPRTCSVPCEPCGRDSP